MDFDVGERVTSSHFLPRFGPLLGTLFGQSWSGKWSILLKASRRLEHSVRGEKKSRRETVKKEVAAVKALKSSIFWGVLIVVAGGLRLLEALGALAVGGWIWSALFGVAGVGFAYVFSRSRENWWAAIPAGALLGLAALVAWGEFGLESADAWGGSLFLGALGAGFWAVYLRVRENWWAIIPGGVFFTLALLTVAPADDETFFFFGLALTFALLAVLPTGEGRMRWPIIPLLACSAYSAWW